MTITFLPYPDFAACARSLDSQRLGQQRREAKQILCASLHAEMRCRPELAEAISPTPGLLFREENGTVHHPATQMWIDYPIALACYGIAICKEWRRRGYHDEMMPDFEGARLLNCHVGLRQSTLPPQLLPPWLGDPRLHQSHRSNLLRKDRSYYQAVCGWWDDPHDLPYFWPGRHYEAR